MIKSRGLIFWEWTLKILISASLIVPLLVVSHIVGNLVFIKMTVFQILVEGALAVYLILWGLNPEKYRPRFSWLAMAILLFMLILGLSTIFSIQPWNSFWGTAARVSGLFTYLHYGAFFLILSWSFHNKRDWTNLIKVAIFASFAVALYALAQAFHFPFVREQTGTRVVGPLSNAIALANYLLPLFFLALIYGLRTNHKIWRWVFLVGALLQVWAVSLTGSRGALLAMIFGLFIFALIYIRMFHAHLIKRVLIAMGALVLAGGVFVWGLKQLPITPDQFILYRIATISLSAQSVQTRLHAWDISLEAFKEKPLLGYGPENFEVAFQQNYFPLVEKFANKAETWSNETWFDRAHNNFLDYLVMAGLLGLIAYLLVLAVAFVGSLLIALRGSLSWQSGLVVAAVSALSAYVVTSISSFDVESTFIILFFLLALINSFGRLKSHDDNSRPMRYSWLMYVLAVIVGVGLWPIQIKNTIANRTAGQAVAVFYKRDFISSQELFEKSLNYNTFLSSAITNKMLESGLALMTRPEAEDNLEMLKHFADLFEEKIPQPLSGKYYSVLAGYYAKMALIDPSYLEPMNEIFEKAVTLAPQRPLLYLVWGGALTETGQHQEALGKYEKAVEIFPELSNSYFWLGVGQIAVGRQAEGEASIAKAAEMGVNTKYPNRLLILANVYESTKRYSQAEALYQEMIEVTDGQSNVYRAVIGFYYRIGQYRKAYDIGREYLKVVPEDEEVASLLGEIKQKFPYFPAF